jgi:hypothetical protein
MVMNTKFSVDRWSKLAGLRSLNEAVSLRRPSALAVGQFQDEDGITIVIYDPAVMKTAIESVQKKDRGDENDLSYKVAESIEGMIRISPPAYGPTSAASSCRGAWEVMRSAVRKKGTGMGSLLYKLAADASPTGKIMPDRRSVSGDAQNMWKSAYSRMSPEKKEETKFDDENNPKTEDPDDDCLINSDGEFLNHAFEDIGKVSGAAKPSFALHEDFMEDIKLVLPKGFNFEKFFWGSALNLFSKVYDQ